jgi:hypothetical protein
MNIIDIAKRDPRQHSKQFWLSELEKRASATRRPGQSREQAFAKVCETADGLALFRASQAAQYEQPAEVENLQKRYAADLGLADTVTEKLAACVLALEESCPHMDRDVAIETVLKRNPEAAALMRRENGLPIQKGDALSRFGRLSDAMIRRGHAQTADEAAARITRSHPGLTDAARREGDIEAANEVENFGEVGKSVSKGGMVRRSTPKVRQDAMDRLTSLAAGLMGDGGDGKPLGRRRLAPCAQCER